MKQKNAKPRAVGDKADKTTKRQLLALSEDPTSSRLAAAARAATHIHQLMDVAVARVHKPRAFRELLERLPPIVARAARRAAAELDARRQQCVPRDPDDPPVCRGGSRVWRRRAD